MTLCLSLKTSTPIPLEVEGIVPSRLQSMALAEIERLDVFCGNVKAPLAEFFSVSGDAGDRQLVWEGDLQGVHWIGAKMDVGSIRVAGNVGRHLGSGMSGGEIDVAGHAGDWVGGEMAGGIIRVQGDAGHLVGAAYRGSARGMTGGTIIVHGRAGNEIGHTMRRGLISVGQQAGDLIGFGMLAGSILIAGSCGIRPGGGMKRGTIVLWGDPPPLLLPTFRYACSYRPGFLQLVFRQLEQLGFVVPPPVRSANFALHHGDLLEGGRGEILIGMPP